jgi:hypothetical protein
LSPCCPGVLHMCLWKKYHRPPQHHPLNMPLLTTLHQDPCTLTISKLDEVQSSSIFTKQMKLGLRGLVLMDGSWRFHNCQYFYLLMHFEAHKKVCRNNPPHKVYWFAQYTMQIIREHVTMSRGREGIVAYERPSHPIQHRIFTHICTWPICLIWLRLDGYRVFEANSSVKTTINTILNCILYVVVFNCWYATIPYCPSWDKSIHLEVTYLWIKSSPMHYHVVEVI